MTFWLWGRKVLSWEGLLMSWKRCTTFRCSTSRNLGMKSLSSNGSTVCNLMAAWQCRPITNMWCSYVLCLGWIPKPRERKTLLMQTSTRRTTPMIWMVKLQHVFEPALVSSCTWRMTCPTANTPYATSPLTARSQQKRAWQCCAIWFPIWLAMVTSQCLWSGVGAQAESFMDTQMSLRATMPWKFSRTVIGQMTKTQGDQLAHAWCSMGPAFSFRLQGPKRLFLWALQRTFAEAEVYACSSGSSDAVLLSRMLSWLTGRRTHVYVYTDSSGARGILQRQGVGRLRHLSCRILWLQGLIATGVIRLCSVSGHTNPADLGTKRLSASRLRSLMAVLGLFNTSTGALEGCDDPGRVFTRRQNVRALLCALSLLQLQGCEDAAPSSSWATFFFFFFFFFFSRSFLLQWVHSESPKSFSGLADCFYTGQSPDVQSPQKSHCKVQSQIAPSPPRKSTGGGRVVRLGEQLPKWGKGPVPLDCPICR